MITVMILAGIIVRILLAPDIYEISFFLLFKEFVKILAHRIEYGGINIMLIGGYLGYLKSLGATDIAAKKILQLLKFVRSKKKVLVIIWLIGICLGLFINSATSLAALLMGIVAPALVKSRIDKLAICSIISTTLCFDWSPADTTCIMSATVSGLTHLDYWVYYQLPIVAVLITIISLLTLILQRNYSSQNDCSNCFASGEFQQGKDNLPSFYTFLPVLPIFILFFTTFVLNIKNSIGSSIVLCFTFLPCLEMYRNKKIKTVINSCSIFIGAFGEKVSSIILLIVAGEFLTKGFINSRLMNLIIEKMSQANIANVNLTIILVCFTFLLSFLMGSSTAIFYSLLPVMPIICKELNITTASVLAAMQIAGGLGRSMSPISAVVLTTASMGNISPLTLAKRNATTMLTALVALIVYVIII